MASENETIADIVAEMRDGVVAKGWMEQTLKEFANRIEAATKREREAGAEAAQICGEIGEMIGREATCKETVTDCHGLGNAAKMREALEALVGVIDKCDSGDPLWWHIGAKGVKPLKDARAALSAPPRNCDIGTAAEQHERFYNFCDKVEQCKECPLWRGGGLTSKCCAHWEQMPYEEGGAK